MRFKISAPVMGAILLTFWSGRAQADLPISINATSTAVDHVVSVTITPPLVASFIAMNVNDPDYADEGQLFVNGQGPIPLFGNQGTAGNDTLNVDVLIAVPASYWKNGNNTLSFRYVSTAGFVVNTLEPRLVQPTNLSALPIAISANNTSADYIVKIASVAGLEGATLAMNVNDPDFPDEGMLYVNGQGPVPLFGAQGNAGNDTLNVDVKIDLPAAYWRAGDNLLTFKYVQTAGYTINTLSVLLQLPLPPLARPTYTAPATPPSDASLYKARRLLQRLAGVALPLDSVTIQAMAADIDGGNMMAAAVKATEDPDFYNITIRAMAAPLTNKDEKSKVALDDFIATFMGVAYNNLDARTLLTGDKIFQGDPSKFTAGELPMTADDRIRSNKHFEYIDSIPQISIASRLMQVVQNVMSGAGAVVTNPEPAGLLTSRSYAHAFLYKGTNRAAIKWALRDFLCADLSLSGTELPLANIRDASIPDYRIGRDVDRAPGGDVTTFKTQCRTCHAGMDALRPAFARWNFMGIDEANTQGILKHTSLFSATATGANESETDVMKDANGIVAKMNQNAQIMPLGFAVMNTNGRAFYAVNPFFGFRGESPDVNGYINISGTTDFGRILSGSEAFGRCMANRAFTVVCKRPVMATELNATDQIGKDFENNGYSLKYLFQRISTLPTCLGE